MDEPVTMSLPLFVDGIPMGELVTLEFIDDHTDGHWCDACEMPSASRRPFVLYSTRVSLQRARWYYGCRGCHANWVREIT